MDLIVKSNAFLLRNNKSYRFQWGWFTDKFFLGLHPFGMILLKWWQCPFFLKNYSPHYDCIEYYFSFIFKISIGYCFSSFWINELLLSTMLVYNSDSIISYWLYFSLKKDHSGGSDGANSARPRLLPVSLLLCLFVCRELVLILHADWD